MEEARQRGSQETDKKKEHVTGQRNVTKELVAFGFLCNHQAWPNLRTGQSHIKNNVIVGQYKHQLKTLKQLLNEAKLGFFLSGLRSLILYGSWKISARFHYLENTFPSVHSQSQMNCPCLALKYHSFALLCKWLKAHFIHIC